MTQKQIGILGLVVTTIGVIIAYLTLESENSPSISTSGNGSPIIQGSENVEINNN